MPHWGKILAVPLTIPPPQPIWGRNARAAAKQQLLPNTSWASLLLDTPARSLLTVHPAADRPGKQWEEGAAWQRGEAGGARCLCSRLASQAGEKEGGQQFCSGLHFCTPSRLAPYAHSLYVSPGPF